MAFGSSSYLKNPSVLEQLLEEINFQRTKEMRQLMKDDSGFVVLQGTTYWTDLFVRHFLFQEDQAIDCDDLLFFVRKRHVKSSSRYLPKYETDVEVFRKDSKKLPIGDPDIDWEETVYLNLIIHQFDYTLTLAVCTRTSPKELQVLKRHSQKVYASPSRRKMDTKGDGEEMTYPHICFMVDNFDEVFSDIVVRDGEMVCVELVAADRCGAVRAAVFLGSIRYDALHAVYDSRQSSLGSKVAQRMSFGLWAGGAAARCEFVRMKGPQGKGHAEMAVSKPRGSGLDTPCSEPGLCATDMWDSDWDEDPEDFYVYRHQRRLSDPSANVNNFCRGGWKTKNYETSGSMSRSENEGLDSMMNGVTEIEAGDVRDEERRRSGLASSPHCWRRSCCAPAPSCDMAEVYRRDPALANRTPACLHRVTAGAKPVRARRDPPKLKLSSPKRFFGRKANRNMDNAGEESSTPKKSSKSKIIKEEYEIADDAGSLNEDEFAIAETDVDTSTVKATKMGRLSDLDPTSVITVNGKEELPSAGARADDANGNTTPRACSTLPRRGRALPPRRCTPDGTDIYYWCDMPKRKSNELDDGAYNPLWAMRGFTQTFHLWKEGKRQQSAPLNAFLTYVTLPWWSIAKDILDHREEPILTF